MNKIIAGLLGLTTLFVLACQTTDRAAAARAEVASVTGFAEIQRGQQWQSLRAGEILGVGDQIRTGADGTVEVRFAPHGGVMGLQPDSMLRFEQIGATLTNQQVVAVVDLDRGRVIGDTLKLPKGSKVVVKTRGGSFAIP